MDGLPNDAPDGSHRYRLVVTIIAERLTQKVVDILSKVGGQAITVVRGRGRDLIMPETLFGLPIEPEREMLFLVVEEAKVDAIVDAIKAAGDLDRPGHGLLLVTDLARVEGFIPAGRESRD